MHKNKVELIGHYGSDLTHALAAWTSTSRDLDVPERGGKTKRSRVGPLLQMLAEDGHHTPYEKSTLHFLCTTDIATHIHILKHRIGLSVNSESARYAELKEDKFYVPDDWPVEEMTEYVRHLEESFKLYHSLMERLVGKGMSRKRAKESARLVLPYGMQYTIDITFNFRSFMHFVFLRYSRHAQREVREVARQMLEAAIRCGSFTKSFDKFGIIKTDGKVTLEEHLKSPALYVDDENWAWHLREPFGTMRLVEV